MIDRKLITLLSGCITNQFKISLILFINSIAVYAEFDSDILYMI